MSPTHHKTFGIILIGCSLAIVASAQDAAVPVKKRRYNISVSGPVTNAAVADALEASGRPGGATLANVAAPSGATRRAAFAEIITPTVDPTDPGGTGGWTGGTDPATDPTPTITTTQGATSVAAAISADPYAAAPRIQAGSLGGNLDASVQVPVPGTPVYDAAPPNAFEIDDTVSPAGSLPDVGHMNTTIIAGSTRDQVDKTLKGAGMSEDEAAEDASSREAMEAFIADQSSGSSTTAATILADLTAPATDAAGSLGSNSYLWHAPATTYAPSGNAGMYSATAADQGTVLADTGNAPLQDVGPSDSLPAGFNSATTGVVATPDSVVDTTVSFASSPAAGVSAGETLQSGYQAWVPILVPMGEGGGGTSFGDSLSAGGGDGVLVNVSGYGIQPTPTGTGGGGTGGGSGGGIQTPTMGMQAGVMNHPAVKKLLAMMEVDVSEGGGGTGGGGTGGGTPTPTSGSTYNPNTGIGVGGPGWTAQDVKWINIWLGPGSAPNYGKVIGQPLAVQANEVTCSTAQAGQFNSYKKTVVQSAVGGIYYATFQKVQFYGLPVAQLPTDPANTGTTGTGMNADGTPDTSNVTSTIGGTSALDMGWPPSQDMVNALANQPNCNYTDTTYAVPKIYQAWDLDADGIPDCWDADGDGKPDQCSAKVSSQGGGQVIYIGRGQPVPPPAPAPAPTPTPDPGTTTGGTGTDTTGTTTPTDPGTGSTGTGTNDPGGTTGGGGTGTTDPGGTTGGGGTGGGSGGGSGGHHTEIIVMEDKAPAPKAGAQTKVKQPVK
jgi:hypothetical protein